jgi:hypothetical protein
MNLASPLLLAYGNRVAAKSRAIVKKIILAACVAHCSGKQRCREKESGFHPGNLGCDVKE